ncbi:MAG: MBL fold metallo-hydrolase, partial [Oscillospiraceae bacterium]
MKKRAGARGKARWKAEKRWAAALAGLLALAVLTALMLTLPGFTEALYRLLGITQVKVPVVGTSDVPVAVHVIDVGQGDAVLLEDHGAFALVDAGPPEAADVVVEYLRLVGVQALDYVVMTHPHADHIGGMQKVSERFEVKKVLLPNFDLAPYPTTSTFVDLLALWLEDEVPAETAKAGQVWPLGQGSLSVVHAGLETDEEHNRLSLGVLFEGGGLRFLNTGDAEKPNERAMLEAGADVAADVFLAAHHGS